MAKDRGTRKSLGARGEAQAAIALEALGFTLLARNYRTRWGELDLVAHRPDALWFVEVKSRRAHSPEAGRAAGQISPASEAGPPPVSRPSTPAPPGEEAPLLQEVSFAQRRRLTRMAYHFLTTCTTVQENVLLVVAAVTFLPDAGSEKVVIQWLDQPFDIAF